MIEDDYADRRRHPRIPAMLAVRISTIEPERDPWTGKPFFRASQETCGNVSRGGAFVRTGEPLAPGRRVLLEMELPDGTPLEAIGRVAWTMRIMTPHERDREAGIGIEFLGGASDQFSQLDHFLSKQADD